jgi:hypothetical protein
MNKTLAQIVGATADKTDDAEVIHWYIDFAMGEGGGGAEGLVVLQDVGFSYSGLDRHENTRWIALHWPKLSWRHLLIDFRNLVDSKHV